MEIKLTNSCIVDVVVRGNHAEIEGGYVHVVNHTDTL